MKIVGYTSEHQKDVINCLKRNYKWMSEKSDSELIQWIDPIINYTWEREFTAEQYPYKKGMVLLNDEGKTVGYLGLIYSRQLVNQKYKTIVNPTTWAIDEEYRSEIFKCIYYVQQTADIVLDFTARQSLVEIFTKMFQYQNVDTIGCFFLPKPFLGKRKIRIQEVSTSDQIENSFIRKIYDDHRLYGIKCVGVSDNNTKEYLFYKIIKKATVLKGILPLNGIYVLYTSDNLFFGTYAREIIWKLQKKERAVLKTDSRFFNISQDEWKNLRIYPINRLVYGEDDYGEKMGSIYTELSILLNE